MLERAVGEENRLKLDKELATTGRGLILYLLYLTDRRAVLFPNIAVAVISVNV